MFALISDILEAVRVADNFKSLRGVEFTRNQSGEYEYWAGNNAVVLRVRYQGGDYALRCYRRTNPYLGELYGDRYLASELNVGGVLSPRFVDVVLCEWVDGESLSRVVERCDAKMLRSLAAKFDAMACALLRSEWAHGDLAPENIVVDSDGELHMVDLDARYIPEFEGRESVELGTQSYQSPHRTARDFHSRIDDFSIIIISTSLHALAAEPTLRGEYSSLDGLLLDGGKVMDRDYEVKNRMLELFARGGHFVQYRALKSMVMSRVVVDALPSLLSERRGVDGDLELFVTWGLCGYSDAASGEVVIPPLYDEAFEFRGDFALVRLSRWWFYIDKSGRAVESCGEWTGGKPPKCRMSVGC